jgi:tetratricopeptide (TPR) repeat protein
MATLSLSFLIILLLVGWTIRNRGVRLSVEISEAAAWLEEGRCDRACAILAKLDDRTPGLVTVLNRAAAVCLQTGSTSAARRALERSLRIRDDQAEAEKMLAAIYLSGGDELRAVRLLERAARREPSDFRPWYALGRVFHGQGRWNESAEAYRQALLRSPPPAEARESQIGRIRSLLDGGRGDEVDAPLAELRGDSNPEDPRVTALAARRAAERGDSAGALSLADRAVDLERSFETLLIRARIRFTARLSEGCAEDLQEALALQPGDLGALQLLLQVQSALGWKSEAAKTRDLAEHARRRRAQMDAISQAIQRNPEDPEPRYRMGRAAAEARMFTLAEQSFRAALDLDASYLPARGALAELAHARASTPAGESRHEVGASGP